MGVLTAALFVGWRVNAHRARAAESDLERFSNLWCCQCCDWCGTCEQDDYCTTCGMGTKP